MPLQTGHILKTRLLIIRTIQHTGLGALYKAWDLKRDCLCTIKENRGTQHQTADQFSATASLLASLTHPNLPKVLGHFSIEEQGHYLVMDSIEGHNLQQLVEKQGGPLPESDVLRWIIQICVAISYLHNQKPPILHLDLQPANILIASEGKAMLADFGLAKVFDPLQSFDMGERTITPGYSPPEQYGQGSTDTRSDVYALGATLYTLLTGEVPTDCISMMTRKQASPRNAASLNPNISTMVNVAITQAMELDQSQRYQSIEEFRSALAAVLSEGSSEITDQPAIQVSIKSQSSSEKEGTLQPQLLKEILFKKFIPWVAGVEAVIILILALMTVWPNDPKEIAITAASQTSQPPSIIITEPSLIAPTIKSPPATVVPTLSSTPTPTLTVTNEPTSTPSSTLTPADVMVEKFSKHIDQFSSRNYKVNLPADTFCTGNLEVRNQGGGGMPRIMVYFSNALYTFDGSTSNALCYLRWYSSDIRAVGAIRECNFTTANAGVYRITVDNENVFDTEFEISLSCQE